MHELVIRNGTIVDGTGAPSFVGDIAIDGGHITAVGQVGPEAAQTIDAKGMIVTPGFVDVHTHFDAQVAWDPDLSWSCYHGVTSVVMGNCGTGLAPVLPNKQDEAINQLSGVEGLTIEALNEGVKFEWETFPEYLSFLKSKQFALDVGAMVPHDLVRAYVMGDRAWSEPGSPEDIKRIADVVRDGISAGAVGFSTGRANHRARDGRFVPSHFALEEELLAVGRGMADIGAGTLQVGSAFPMPNDLGKPIKEQAWLRQFADLSHRPISATVNQRWNNSTYWRACLNDTIDAAEHGSTLRLQNSGIALWGIQSLVHGHGFRRTPYWREQMSGLDHAGQLDAMADPKVRSTLIQEGKALQFQAEADGLEISSWPFPFSYIYLTCKEGTDVPDWEPAPEVSVRGIAAREGRNEWDVFYDLLLEKDGSTLLSRASQNYFEHNMNALHEMLTSGYCDVGLGDAGAHVASNIGYSTPTRMITHWARDRWRGPKMRLEDAVRKQTLDTASLFNMNDRGVIMPGFRADINVIDYDKLGVELPKLVFDMPAGGQRILQAAKGYKYTIVKGEITLKDGELTGARPGRLVEGEQHVSNDYWQAARKAIAVN